MKGEVATVDAIESLQVYERLSMAAEPDFAATSPWTSI